jgi:hypothetical protein
MLHIADATCRTVNIDLIKTPFPTEADLGRHAAGRGLVKRARTRFRCG